jgi:glycosyltransferase involved in cell wall biosynthesis
MGPGNSSSEIITYTNVSNETMVTHPRTPALSKAEPRHSSRTAQQKRNESSPKIRVLFFDHTAVLSGGEIALLRLIGGLDRQKVSPVVVLGADGPLADALRPIADTHILPLDPRVANTRKGSLGVASLTRFRDVCSVMAYVWRLVRFIKHNKIDLVHTNSLKSDIIGGAAGRLAARPVLWHVRDRIDNDYLPRRVVPFFRFLCRTVPNYVIANSFATLRTLWPPGGPARLSVRRNKTEMVVVHDGTHVGDLDHQPKPALGPVRIGLVGRICPWKGQHIFLQAAAIVRKAYPNTEFLIIGAALFGEHEFEEELRRLTRELALDDVVRFAGFRTDVEAAIAELDVLVHASTIGEPFGQVIIEGMAAGKPVVATDGGGVSEIVQDGDTGLLVPMADSQAMAAAISRLLANSVLANAMGCRGRKRVLDQFTVGHTARKVESVYDSILSSRWHTAQTSV